MNGKMPAIVKLSWDLVDVRDVAKVMIIYKC